MKKNNNLVAPILKWVGGKRQLLPTLRTMFPNNFSSYYEPFVGGGAVLFDLQPKKAVINDVNPDLILLYQAIRDNVEGVICELEKHRNDADYFYEIRSLDRNKEVYSALSDAQKAARVLYLNKTCYNGLYRVNQAGEFNSPFGKYKNPNIVNAETLRAVSGYFNDADVQMTVQDYAKVLDNIPRDAFVYLDPPYDPLSQTSNFTGYTKGGFSHADQIRLRECCDSLNARGVKFMLSNSATDFILDQYKDYNISIIQAKRAINSNAAKRGAVDEVIVRNYE